MIDKHVFEMINKDIDGTATADEQKSLRCYLDTHADARDYYNELVRVAAGLRKVRPVEPPADLKAAIMAKLPSHKPAASRTTPLFATIFELIREWLEVKPSYSLALGTVMGALVVTSAFYIYSAMGGRDTGSVAGTMMPLETQTQQVAKVSMSVAQNNISVTTERGGDQVLCKVETHDPMTGILGVSFDQADLSLSGILRDSGQIDGISIADGQITVRLWDQGVTTLVFRDLSLADSRLGISVTQQEATVSRQISTGGSGDDITGEK